MADGIIEEEIVKITVDDKDLEDLPRKMGKVTGEMNSYLALTSGVAQKTGDQWTKVAVDLIRDLGSVGDATSALAAQLKGELPKGVKAVDVAIKIMDKTLTQTMASMIKSNVPMEEMQQWFEKIGASGEDFTRILGVAQSQLAETPKAIMPAIEGIKELGGAMDDISPERLFTATRKGLISLISQMYEMGMSTEEVAQAFVDVGRTGRDVQTAMVKVNDDVDGTREAFEKLEPAVKRTDWSWKGITKSIEWAAYRFMFALAIYMGFRKIIRSINEVISESITLYKEWTGQQERLNRLLILYQATSNTQIGTSKEWLDYVDELSSKYLLHGAALLEITNQTLAYARNMGLTQDQLRDLINLEAILASQLVTVDMTAQQHADTIRKVGEAFTDAIAGRGITALEELTAVPLGGKLKELETAFDDAEQPLDEYTKMNFRLAAILALLNGELIKTPPIIDATARSQQRLAQVNWEKMGTEMGGYLSNFGLLSTELKSATAAITAFVLSLIAIVAIGVKALTTAPVEGIRAFAAAIAGGEGILEGFKAFLFAYFKDIVSFMHFWGLDILLPKDVQEQWAGLLDWKKTGTAESAKKEVWTIDTVWQDFMKKFQDYMAGIKDTGTDAFSELGKAVVDAIQSWNQGLLEAKKDFDKDWLDTFEDQKKDELKLEERYADKADDLRKRAADRIADLRKRATEEEERDRADLLLRLHQMEEDYQLSMKQLYENYQMNYEEAARTRDAVTMRRLTRQYKLEKKQRTDDYNLQVHQTVESWEARHKENQANLDAEIKEVQDSLAVELAELEAEKAAELQEIKDNWDERRQELKDQYAEELADLKAALQRRLTEAITEWADQNNIPRDAVIDAVAAMADQYGLDVTNLTNMVNTELDLLEALRAAWDAVRKAAGGEITDAIKKPTFIPGRKTSVTGFATGGMAIATAPTLVRVGEAGPELFTAIPLARGGSVLGGARGYGGGDFHLSIDGNQTGLWSSDFERGVEHTVAKIFKEAFQE